MANKPKTTSQKRGSDTALVEAIDRHAQAIRELAAAIQSGVAGFGGFELNSLNANFEARTARPNRLRELSMDEIFVELKSIYGRDIKWDDSVNVYAGAPGAFADTYQEINERPLFKARGLNLTNGVLAICSKFSQVAQLIAHELSR